MSVCPGSAIKKIIGIENAGITYVFDGKSRIMTANANVTTNSKTSIDTAARSGRAHV